MMYKTTNTSTSHTLEQREPKYPYNMYVYEIKSCQGITNRCLLSSLQDVSLSVYRYLIVFVVGGCAKWSSSCILLMPKVRYGENENVYSMDVLYTQKLWWWSS